MATTPNSVASTVEVQVLGISRYQFDGNSGGKVFTHQVTDANNPDVLGLEVVEFPCEYALLDHCRGQGIQFPAKCRLDFQVARGAKGRPVMRVKGIIPIGTMPPKS
jgi:hypothetical protein